jgi:hypothetical protein
MIDLAKKAMERLKSGGLSRPSDESESIHPLKDAMKEAFEAAKDGDFDRYFNAFESALDIRLAEFSTHKEEDKPGDVEAYELDELNRQ